MPGMRGKPNKLRCLIILMTSLPHNSDDFFSQLRIRSNALAALEIFKSPDYKLFQDAINSEMKGLARKGVGVVTKQAEPIASHDEEVM